MVDTDTGTGTGAMAMVDTDVETGVMETGVMGILVVTGMETGITMEVTVKEAPEVTDQSCRMR